MGNKMGARGALATIFYCHSIGLYFSPYKLALYIFLIAPPPFSADLYAFVNDDTVVTSF